MSEGCWLGQFVPDGDPRRACRGALIRAHLIEQRKLVEWFGRDRGKAIAADPRSWVPACGGLTGLNGHHGMLDAYKIEVPGSALPAGVWELAAELDGEHPGRSRVKVTTWLERRFGPRR